MSLTPKLEERDSTKCLSTYWSARTPLTPSILNYQFSILNYSQCLNFILNS